jgi:hypothetical protein
VHLRTKNFKLYTQEDIIYRITLLLLSLSLLPLEHWGVCLDILMLPLLLRITIYSRQVISLALEARYLRQLDSQYLYPLGNTGGPAKPPRHWLLILVAFYDTHELRWGYSLLPAITRGLLFLSVKLIRQTQRNSHMYFHPLTEDVKINFL